MMRSLPELLTILLLAAMAAAQQYPMPMPTPAPTATVPVEPLARTVTEYRCDCTEVPQPRIGGLGNH
jgi:hypothetical protein